MTTPKPTPDVELYEAKMFSAKDVAELIKNAKDDFAMECRAEDKGECVYCHDGKHTPVNRAQDFNDVGGPGTLMCECCWAVPVPSNARAKARNRTEQ